MTYFYDTCALLNKQSGILNSFFYISNISLKELENIKTSNTKDESTKYTARKIIKMLDDHEDMYKVVDYDKKWDIELSNYSVLPESNDSKIILCALHANSKVEDLVFCTDDICCKLLAIDLGLQVHYIKDKLDDYKGYREVRLNEYEMAEFYQHKPDQAKKLKMINNEYLIVKDIDGKVVDKLKAKDGVFEEVGFPCFESQQYGKVKPKDVYQEIAMDSLKNNKITMLAGPAGSGKSYLAMAYMMTALEKGAIDHIIIVCNPIATRGAAKLGFYPGDKDCKLLDSQIGNFLNSKFGDAFRVESLIDNGKIILIPLSDLRGYDTSGMNACIYMTESQNTDIDLMKLVLQRTGDDCKVIIEGDYSTQVDSAYYAGVNNGMKRASEVFRGHNCYGQVNLQSIWRSEIAEIAEQM
jgi:predicted ribonuclease YlaK